jgi:arylsulfatase A-like enzyme
MLRPQDNNNRAWWDPVAHESEAIPYGTNYWSNGELVSENLRGDDSRVIVDRAIPFIRDSVAAQTPFFAIVWFHAPHLPVVAGPKYTALYKDFDKHTQHYYGCITALDEQVGRLRNELQELGIAAHTLICFCSDNGPEGSSKSPGSAKHLRGRKRSLFEGGVRVPGIIEWPARIKAGTETRLPATTSDYLPTIVDLLGANLPDARPIDGISLLPLFDGKMQERPKPIGFQSSGQLSLVDNRYKIIWQRPSKSTDGKRKQKEEGEELSFMLFDLIDDPSESRDLASEQPEVVSKMKSTLLAWRASCQASDAGDDYD